MKTTNYSTLFLLLLLLKTFCMAAQEDSSDCQLPNSFLTGDYTLIQTTPASNSPFNVLSFENQIVNISEGETADKRQFSAVWYEGLGIDQNPMLMSFALDCSEANDIVVDSNLNTLLSCSGSSIIIGPASTMGTFDENDDSSFTLIISEFVNGSCNVATPVVTEFTLTKCSVPKDVSFTNQTSTSIDLNWMDFGDSFNIEYGVAGFELGTGQTITNVTGDSFTIANLQEDTSYDFYLLNSCSGLDNVSGPFPYGNFNNPDFTLASNGVTCLCPDADFADVGNLEINGEIKTFTKRSRIQLDDIIADDIQNPQIALTCTSGITDMSSLFENQTSFNQNLEHWDVSNVTTMSFMFSGSNTFNQPLNMWNVSQVTDMARMFSFATAFNQPLDNWDVSNVIDMSFMFISLSPQQAVFDQNINNWDVSNVTNMAQMFVGQPFNQPLDNWDVSQVTDINAMFALSQFNQPLNSWDVSNVTNMAIVFADNQNFNQPLDNWDVSNVTSMSGMFRNASSFNQDISDWNFNQNILFGSFLNNSNLSTINYDLLLQSFDSQNLVDKNLQAIGVGYCDETSRNNLINHKNWTIDGDILGQCGAIFNPSTTPFVTTWTVEESDLEIEIYTINAYEYDFIVDWGDGQVNQNVSSDISHTYSDSGTYTVSITGVFPYFKTCKVSTGLSNINLNNCDNTTKLSSVESWGNQEWRFMEGSFNSVQNLSINTSQAPDLSNVMSLRDLFRAASNFNDNINSWDVSNVTNMASIFSGASSFNQPLDNWDVSNVSNMNSMFREATDFDQPLNSWDVSSVTTMIQMFSFAYSFNQPLDNWDVSNVTNMVGMFRFALYFNQPLDNWDVSNVTNMAFMFNSALSFNQDISNWCVEQIEEEPNDFALDAPLQIEFFPDWGADCETFSINNEDFSSFSIYPNPVRNQLTFNWGDMQVNEKVKIQIYSITGKEVFSRVFNQQPTSINLRDLATGVYFLKLNSGSKSAVRKILKK